MDPIKCRDDAVKHIKIADHMLVTTYPIVDEPKLLISIVENVQKSLDAIICSLVYYKRERKETGTFNDTPKGRLEAAKNHISGQKIKLIDEVNDILEERARSNIEFSRKDNFVIANDDYKKLKMLNDKDVRDMIGKAKLFIAEVSTIIEEK